MKTCCALVLVLLGIVVAVESTYSLADFVCVPGADECLHPDCNPTTCCARASERECSIYRVYDRKIQRTPTPFRKTIAETEAACYQLCKHVVDGCKAVNFIPRVNNGDNCEFMNILAGPEAITYHGEVNAPYISAVVNPSCEDIQNGMHMIKGYYRNPLSGATNSNVANYKDCMNLCLDDETCLAYNYDPESKDCRPMPGAHDIKTETPKNEGQMTGFSCPYLANECTCS